MRKYKIIKYKNGNSKENKIQMTYYLKIKKDNQLDRINKAQKKDYF